jgi:hypothetical protein
MWQREILRDLTSISRWGLLDSKARAADTKTARFASVCSGVIGRMRALEYQDPQITLLLQNAESAHADLSVASETLRELFKEGSDHEAEFRRMMGASTGNPPRSGGDVVMDEDVHDPEDPNEDAGKTDEGKSPNNPSSSGEKRKGAPQ